MDGVPGLALPEALGAVLPLFLDSLRVGTTIVRSHALEGVRYLVAATSATALKVLIAGSVDFFDLS